MSGTIRSRVKYDKICLQCSASFTVRAYRKDTALYCSRKCLGLASRVQTTSICQICSTVFTHIASRANKAKYCSRKCYHKGQKHKGSVEYTCEHCYTKFLDAPSHKRKYCSKTCVNKSAKEHWKPTFSTARKNMMTRGLVSACERCGYAEQPKILGVHHKDRNRKNNDMSNLEVLCPNCHSLEHMKHIAHGFTE